MCTAELIKLLYNILNLKLKIETLLRPTIAFVHGRQAGMGFNRQFLWLQQRNLPPSNDVCLSVPGYWTRHKIVYFANNTKCRSHFRFEYGLWLSAYATLIFSSWNQFHMVELSRLVPPRAGHSTFIVVNVRQQRHCCLAESVSFGKEF